MNLTRKFFTILLPVSLLLFIHCGLLDYFFQTEEPTQKRMQGIWMVTEATDENGKDIMDKINFPATIFQLGNDNSLNSTAGPMGTYLIYGGNKYAEVASKIDQVFDYTKLDPDDGEWFIENGVVSRFTMYFKLISLPGTSSLSNLLEFFGVYTPLLRQVIYHKFIDVKVTFESDDVMIWEFDDQTETDYYTVDGKGYEKPISLSTNRFSRASFVLTKQAKNLQDLITEAAQKRKNN
jgi:hypothetical protein